VTGGIHPAILPGRASFLPLGFMRKVPQRMPAATGGAAKSSWGRGRARAVDICDYL